MTYAFWKQHKKAIPYDLLIKFDVRLCNVIAKLDAFFQEVVEKELSKKEIRFFLAGSCIKADTFRDIDLIFPLFEDKEAVNDALDKNYFEYENNSYTYTYEEDIIQLVFREKFKEASLSFLVDGFDFDSTKIAFECILNTQTKSIEIVNCDIRDEFISYIQTKVNHLSKVSINPFVSLQRAIHFLKRGDDVPYSVFLEICSKIADLKIEQGDKNEKFFDRLQGNEAKLKDIKEAIVSFVEHKKDENEKGDTNTNDE